MELSELSSNLGVDSELNILADMWVAIQLMTNLAHTMQRFWLVDFHDFT